MVRQKKAKGPPKAEGKTSKASASKIGAQRASATKVASTRSKKAGGPMKAATGRKVRSAKRKRR